MVEHTSTQQHMVDLLPAVVEEVASDAFVATPAVQEELAILISNPLSIEGRAKHLLQ